MKKNRIEPFKIGNYMGGRIDWDPDYEPGRLPPANYGSGKPRQQESKPDRSEARSSESD